MKKKTLLEIGFGVKPTNDKKPLYFGKKRGKELETFYRTSYVIGFINSLTKREIKIHFAFIVRKILPELTELWSEWANEIHDNVIPNIRNVSFLDYLQEKYDKH